MADREDVMSEGSEEMEMTIADPAFLDKYKVAGSIAEKVIAKVAEKCVPGAKVVEICNFGDKMIEEETANVFKMEKGVGYPTCINLNNCCGNFSPLEADDVVLQAGDLASIDLGVHIDGAIAVTSHIMEVGAKGPITGKKADVVAAAYAAAEAELRMLAPESKSSEITPVISAICKDYGVNVVDQTASNGVARYVFEDQSRLIVHKNSPEHKVEEFEIGEFEVYLVDMVITSGEGKASEKDARTTVYRRTDKTYQLRLQSARQVHTEIINRFSVMPFSMRHISDSRSRVGITELVKNGLLAQYPVRYDKVGEFVASVKFTVLITPNNTMKITGLLPPPAFTTDKKVTDEKVKEVLAKSLNRKKAGKKAKKEEKAAKAAAAPASSTSPAKSKK